MSNKEDITGPEGGLERPEQGQNQEAVQLEEIQVQALPEISSAPSPVVENSNKNPSKFRTLTKTMMTFLKLSSTIEGRDPAQKWHHRRLRHAHRRHGGIKEPSVIDTVDSFIGDVVDDGAALLPIREKPSFFQYSKEAAGFVSAKIPNIVKKKSTEAVVVAADDKVDSASGIIDAVLDRDDEPREFGIGAVGELLHREFEEDRQTRFVRQQLDEMEDYRPFFTYWVTTVQVIVMIITLCWYGIGNFGVELALKSDFVRTESLTYEQIAFHEPSNFWLGPRAADLIHLGAKFSPCMRSDQAIMDVVAVETAKENRFSGCCVRNDGSGCMQTMERECSPLLSTFHKWSPWTKGPDFRTHGPVCGQDPRYCNNPASKAPHVWQDDLRQWPICTEKSSEIDQIGVPDYVDCQITARPCCIGIHGRCEMRSQEYCDFVNGHFHPEAALCGQVSCMQDVCGMLSFMGQGWPDQFYRLWTSLFLHAGLIHLAISIIVQWYLMRDLEKLCGPLRMSIIYFGSGILGNIASAIFIPYRAESGPSGAHFGLLAALFIEVLNAWPLLKHPLRAMGKLSAIVLLLFILGLFPWVDNYAHIFGFLGGLLLSFAILPYITFRTPTGACSWILFNSETGRKSLMIGATVIYFILLVSFILMFYLAPVLDCQFCKYLSCLPLTADFCADQNIDFATDTSRAFF